MTYEAVTQKLMTMRWWLGFPINALAGQRNKSKKAEEMQ